MVSEDLFYSYCSFWILYFASQRNEIIEPPVGKLPQLNPKRYIKYEVKYIDVYKLLEAYNHKFIKINKIKNIYKILIIYLKYPFEYNGFSKAMILWQLPYKYYVKKFI